MVASDYNMSENGEGVYQASSEQTAPVRTPSKSGLTSKLGNFVKGAAIGAMLYAGTMAPKSADADLVLSPYSWNIDSPSSGIEMKHKEGANDGIDSYDVEWDETPPGMGGSNSQYFYPFTSVNGYELQTDVRGNEAPFTPYEVQIRARDNNGSGFQLENFTLNFRDFELKHGLTDWTYEWVVPSTFTSSGTEYREGGSITNLNWQLDPLDRPYALSQGSVNTTTLNDGDVFSTVYISPIPEPSTVGLLTIGGLALAGAYGRRRKQSKSND